MHQITPPLLNQWMATWNAKTYWSKSKKRDNTVAFFDFCLGSKWIRETSAKDKGNPARGMAKIIGQKESSIPTLPFTPAQFNSILEASKRYDESLLTANRKEGGSQRQTSSCTHQFDALERPRNHRCSYIATFQAGRRRSSCLISH
jgi:hypothetical protein